MKIDLPMLPLLLFNFNYENIKPSTEADKNKDYSFVYYLIVWCEGASQQNELKESKNFYNYQMNSDLQEGTTLCKIGPK